MTQLLNIMVYKDNNDTIVVFKNTNSQTENIIQNFLSSISNTEIDTKEINHLEPLPVDDTPPELPSFMQEEVVSPVPPIGNYKVTGIKKYAKSGKTLTEINEIDNNWLNWIAKNYNPTTPQGQKDLEAIKKFLSTQ